MQLGLDLSNLSGVITPEQAQAWWKQGRRFAILGTQDAAIFDQQYKTLQPVGFAIEAYSFSYWTSDPELLADAAIECVQGRVPRIWIDAEEDDVQPNGTVIQSTTNIDWIVGSLFIHRRYLLTHGKLPLGIGFYSRQDWWERWTNNETTFASMGDPLWSAHTDNIPDLRAGYARYGGWLAPSIKQYAFGNPADLDCW